MNNLCCALDIGNTNSSVGLVDLDQLTCIRRSDVPTKSLVEHAASLVATHLPESSKASHSICISSVVPSLKNVLTREFDVSTNALNLIWVENSGNLPLAIEYGSNHMGADRIANLLFAAKKFPGQHSIVIDVGTAVTVDGLLNGHTFMGGAILPGLQTQFSSLSKDTAALPQISRIHPAPTPGKSTSDCLEYGVVQGLAGAVSRIVSDLSSRLKGQAKILACGGGWADIAALVDFEYEEVPNLTLVGTALYSEFQGGH